MNRMRTLIAPITPLDHETCQAFSKKGVLDGFERNIGRLWTPKILKGKKITSVFNQEALTLCQSKCRIRLFSSCFTLGFLICQAAINVYGITIM